MKPLSILLAMPSLAVAAGISPDQLTFFEKNIRPVLVEQCYKCHSAKSEKIKGKFTLDTRQGMVMGGESGNPGITPGRPDKSTVYEAITWKSEDMQMPPKHKLPESVMASFKKWIEMGAPDPREGTVAQIPKKQINIAEGRKHWAFQKPVKPTPPATHDTQWARTDIDKFLLASMEGKGLHPMADSERPALIRRIAFDLSGLPPTPDEVKAFVADTSPEALKRVIDQYLDSPRYGERWGRHWLDVARYAESSGKEVNVLYPHAWRYRDYVVESFNKDKPYDQFIREQIAGDLLKFQNKRQQGEQIVATGFLAIGAKSHNQRDPRQFAMDVVDEQIDTISQSMLGLTVACARCHDHKFDPIGQRDYYALAGIFLSTDTLYGTHSQQQNVRPSDLVELDDEAGQPPSLAKISSSEIAELKRLAEVGRTQAQEATRTLRAAFTQGKAASKQFDVVRTLFARDQASQSVADATLFRDDGTPRILVMGAMDKNYPVDSPILMRGEIQQPTDTTVPRGLVEVLCADGEPLSIAKGSGRMDLAWFIASKDNPLTARVMVNRIWLHLFGEGIVSTPDNFGTKGMAPANQALLDHLAVRFMDNGWSVKKLIKEIMLSRAYGLSSTFSPANYAVDPDNLTHWRMNKRRLDAEEIRDSMLAVAGTLDLYPVDGSPVARAGDGRDGMIALYRGTLLQPSNYRSVFLPIVRDQVPEALALFDFPDASLVAGQRDSTSVPAQSLYLMNNPQAVAAADAFAARLSKMEVKRPGDRIIHAFQLAYGRAPTADEGLAMQTFFAHFVEQELQGKNAAEAKPKAQFNALSAFCQSLFASAEFRYLN